MRISGNFTDRLIYRILPSGLIFGLLSAAAISSDNLIMNIILTLAIVMTIWLVDFWFIRADLGTSLNRIDINDGLIFNEKPISHQVIVRIETKNIYPNPFRWSITKIIFHLVDGSTFEVLAKPHSIFFLVTF